VTTPQRDTHQNGSAPGSGSDETPSRLHSETLAVRGGRTAGISAMAPILWASTTFEMESLESGHRLAHSSQATEFYSRHGNPTVNAFEDAVASLEGMEAARAYASGMGAIAGVVLGLCSQGDHIVAQRQLYGGTMQLLAGVCPRFGIDVTFVDATQPGAFAAAVQPGRTMMVFAENPANPLLDIVDLEELGAIRGPITVVDSTLSTPLGVRPGDFGVQLVLHSATKAMAGHNDATLGVVAGSRDLIDALWGFAVLQGACASPFDALNGLRGLRTLGPRLHQQSATALAVAQYLETRADVVSVRYPGLASHPRHELAVRQQRVHGGVLAFDVRGGLEAGARFVSAVRLCRPATSMGGPETLVTHPASTTHAGMTPEELAASGITPGTVRISCGLEHVDDVLADIASALDRAST
jgi:cystathionine beta-lyase/cystathionine gamma-synthase